MRSGTTLLADLLGRSSEVVYCGFELKDIWSKIGKVPVFLGESPPSVVERSRCFPGGDEKYLAQYWLENNRAVADFRATLRPNEMLTVTVEELVSDTQSVIAPAQLFHRNQALFASCLTTRIDEDRIRILPARFNYPFHFHTQMQPSARIEQLDLINILHYHDHFEKSTWRDEMSISSHLTDWINTHVVR